MARVAVCAYVSPTHLLSHSSGTSSAPAQLVKVERTLFLPQAPPTRPGLPALCPCPPFRGPCASTSLAGPQAGEDRAFSHGLCRAAWCRVGSQASERVSRRPCLCPVCRPHPRIGV